MATATLTKLVLVADDEPDILDLVSMALARPQLEIKTASNGFQAMELVLKHRPDLLILDVSMPGMTGWEVCEKIRSVPSLKDLPVLFMSAKGQREDIERAYAAGASSYVVKPFELEELTQAVNLALYPG